VGSGPRYPTRVRQRRATAVEHLGQVRVVARARNLPIELGDVVDTLGDPALRALVEHCNDGSYHLQVAELLGGDVDEHILATGVILAEVLGEIATRRSQLSLWAAELFQHEI